MAADGHTVAATHVPSGTTTILCLCSEMLQETQLGEKLEVWGTFVCLLFIWDSSGFVLFHEFQCWH